MAPDGGTEITCASGMSASGGWEGGGGLCLIAAGGVRSLCDMCVVCVCVQVEGHDFAVMIMCLRWSGMVGISSR